MSDDPTARLRSNEIEVPGTPEEVWRAIATGPGHAAWLFPADIEPDEGGAMVIHREPYADAASATVQTWQPPHRFGYREPIGPDRKPLTTEFLVEATRGGSCVVRVVSGFYHDGDGWEDLVDGAGEGWRMALTVLRAYLTHFAGLPAGNVDVIVDLGRPAAQRAAVSARLMELLGLSDVAAGAAFRTPLDAPDLTGTVEHVSEGYVLLRAVAPHPALYAISCFPMADGAPLSANLLARLYGAPAAVAERERARWQNWLVDVRRAFDE
ncbi:SRPBCC domain-containing protein [Phytoactinopolyspora halotolerans]|uniref:SRPBCC domain-containing protein n=2 Tax=Phytoactinopolyspora halotolerans TaxID=1981512 RepID=A0A6L9S5R3_9ACTN|nr:SRPBCC domain-containing protein [Phytoactinopolyspora halotolerans]